MGRPNAPRSDAMPITDMNYHPRSRAPGRAGLRAPRPELKMYNAAPCLLVPRRVVVCGGFGRCRLPCVIRRPGSRLFPGIIYRRSYSRLGAVRAIR